MRNGNEKFRKEVSEADRKIVFSLFPNRYQLVHFLLIVIGENVYAK